MKKLLLTLLISIVGIGGVSADWKVDSEYTYLEPGIVTQCSETPLEVGTTTGTGNILSESDIITICGANNGLTVLTDGTSKSGMTETGAITTSKIGQIIVFFLGFTLLIAVVGLIYKAINKGKNSKNGKSMIVGSKAFKKRAGKVFSKKDIKTLRRRYPKGGF